jgi:putative protein-disulfide isomerase
MARHCDEVSAYYDMPLDGDLWLEDPLPCSFQITASITIKVVDVRFGAEGLKAAKAGRQAKKSLML